ncbi:uncharacterized protein LOC117166895 isoform X2 [Belonocnema kinseyi]|uniref:uncharacterized protein LOC117166895 isoform X2 n=1 Tax=Belonocnema kinseyi TaxID=2817044 RepID=UPI00143CF0E5|nr:uncharacterized protein LOC117166895 isoform X2 [Belonocnema kinseyi]
MKPQGNRHKSFPSWCVPRKTKAVSSTGEIFIDLTSASNVKKKKSRNHTDSDLTSILRLSLTNFGINRSNTNSKSISRQEWMERINEIAEPRIREPNPSNVIGKVTENALKAIDLPRDC